MTLNEWMSEQSLTDADLAVRVHGLSRSQINRIRNKKSRPTPDTAKKLEEATGIPAADFVMGIA